MRSVILVLLSIAVIGLPAEACPCAEPVAAEADCCCGPDASDCRCGCSHEESEEPLGLDARCACDHTPPQSEPTDPEVVTPDLAVAIIADARVAHRKNELTPRAEASPQPPGCRLPLLI
jgi:hypothetical protein